MPSARRARAALLALPLAAVLPYLGSLRYDFHRTDDSGYVTRQVFWQDGVSWESVRELVTRPVMANYQPLHLLSYALDRAVWGPRVLGLRVTQLLLYALCLAALAQLGRRLALPRTAILVAGLVFAWHPAHVENVVWISQRKDLLSLLLSLLALSVWLGPRPWPLARQGGPSPGPGRAAAALGLFLLACLAKTSAVVLVPMLATVLVLRGRLRGRAGLWLLAFLALGLVLARLGYEAQRLFGATPDGALPPLVARLPGVARAYAYYMLQAVVPVAMHPAPATPHGPPGPWEALGFLLLGATLLGAALSWRRGGTFVGWAAWFLLALAPTSGIVPLPVFAQDRYLLVPTVGLALAAGEAVAGLGRRGRVGRRRRLLLGTGLLLLGLFRASCAYAWVWRDDLALWTYAAAAQPENTGIQERFALTLARSDDPAAQLRGEALLLRLLERRPWLVESSLWAAQRALQRGQRERARALLRGCRIASSNRTYAALLLLALLDIEDGRLEDAQRDLDEAATRSPPLGAELAAARGRLALARGDLPGARAHYRDAVSALPEWGEAWRDLAVVERLAGDRQAAAEAARRATPAGRAGVEAQLLLDQGQLEAAAARMAGIDEPTETELELARIRLALARGLRDEAEARLSGAARNFPGDWVRRLAWEPDLGGAGSLAPRRE